MYLLSFWDREITSSDFGRYRNSYYCHTQWDQAGREDTKVYYFSREASSGSKQAKSILHFRQRSLYIKEGRSTNSYEHCKDFKVSQQGRQGNKEGRALTIRARTSTAVKFPYGCNEYNMYAISRECWFT